jgi:hypothetical protein
MKTIHKRLLATTILALGVGALAIVPVVNSDNGYVAGYVFFPLFCLICITAFILFFAGLVTITKAPGPYLLLASILLPVGFVGAAFVSKSLVLGAYKEDPMVSFPPPIANKVEFKLDATDEQIEKFWTQIIGYSETLGGMSFRPGVVSAARSGHRTITFAFRDNATDEQKNDMRERINNYPPVQRFLESVDTRPTETPEADIDNANTKKPVKVEPREPSRVEIVR